MVVLPGCSPGDVEERVKAYLAASGVPDPGSWIINVSDPPISVAPIGGGARFTVMRVQVQVTHTFTLLRPIAALVGGAFATVPLTSESTMRTEVAFGGS